MSKLTDHLNSSGCRTGRRRDGCRYGDPCPDASARKATPVVAALSKSAATVAPSELACPITPMTEGRTFLTTGTQQNRRRRCMLRPPVFTIDRGRAVVNLLHLSVVSAL